MRIEFFLLLGSVFLGASGQILLKYATGTLKPINLEFSALPYTIFKVFTNGWIIAGLSCFAVSMMIWLKVLSTMELSRAYPSVSLSYILIFTMSVILFKEDVTLFKIIGLCSICMGVFFIHR